MPLELSKLTPAGAPLNEYTIGIVPVAVTWKEPPVPLTALLLFELVTTGATGAGDTVRLNVCVVSGGSPLLATIVYVYVPAGTVAATVIRPFALLILTPDGAPVNE
jgi:hypothetical protein